VLDANASAELIGKELAEIDRQAAAKIYSRRLPSGVFAGTESGSAGD
jgi:hypothetical protein